MRGLKRIALVIVVIVVVGLATAVGTLAWITGRALPQTTGSLRAAGLSAPVSVQRDINGIAQITATSSHDLFMAQGYVHASERMWQMEVWRHIGAGRLSELFGKGSVGQDRFIRTLGWRQAAERDLAGLTADTRAVLDAYASGVNAWLDANRDRLGLSFVVVGDRPEPWTALDTLTWAKVQAWNLGGNMDAELFRYLADARLGDPARTDELLAPREFGPVIVPAPDVEPAADTGHPAPTDAIGAAAPTLTAAQAAAWRDVARLGGHALALAGLDGSGRDALASDHSVGSNDWVVGPAMSASGGALLGNDPHLGISMPSVWYINGLHCAAVDAACPYDVVGVTFPGVPGVVLGHNGRIAWGVTNAEPDVQDLVIETVDPADPTHYLGPDGTSRPFTTRTETIAVAGGDPVAMTVRETIHGPLLNDVDDRLDGAPLMALRWSATLPEAAPDRTVEAFLRIDAAGDFAAFRDALSVYGAPAQNFVYADVDGHIGYQLPGYLPVRSDPEDRGLRPVSGSDGTGEWTGRIPFDDLPTALDPVDGWIVSANNAIVDAADPRFFGADFDPGYRAERIIDLIGGYGQDGLTLPEMSTIQNDTAPLRAEDIALFIGEAGTAGTADGARVAARIADWDGACTVDSLGCAAYMTWEYRVLRAIFDDDLGPLARDYVGSPASWVALSNLLLDPSSPWWDDGSTPDVVEAQADVIGRALDQAGADLQTLGDPDTWTWGRLHTATFREQTIGTASGIGPLEWYLNVGPLAVPGAAGAVNNTYYQLSRGYPDPEVAGSTGAGIDEVFTVTNLPSYRLVVDLSDLDGARVVITTGQSGLPFERHYNDQVATWRDGGSLPLPFSRTAIDAATVATLTLQP
ncbi:MAG TPA: penicillin acylase family protein [Candidatus Limnocylindrales bacterium]|nr:penicillin acylase family protein [Candidatus Limnocylindrales bacterium]